MSAGHARNGRYFVLEGREIKPFSGTHEAWMSWMIEHPTVIGADYVGPVLVSTMFNGKIGALTDHPGIPDHIKAISSIFSSSVFGGKLSGSARGYSTFEEAERGHQDLLASVIEI